MSGSTLEIRLPGPHQAQRAVEAEASRFNALVCGRRWGKSKLLTRRMCLAALRGERYGYFAATYKLVTEVFAEAAHALSPVSQVKKTEKRIECATGGLIEFWTLENPDAGRSRKYHEVGIDEAGLVKDLASRWNDAIRPTLTDYRGSAWLAGTPKGRNWFATAYQLGQDPLERDWSSWRMPTSTNPWIPADEIEAARRQMPDRSFRQEFLAEFLDDAGGVFLGVRDCVDAGRAESRQQPGEQVFVGIDLARTVDFTAVSVVGGAGDEVVQHELHRWNRCPWQQTVERIVGIVGRVRPRMVVVDATGVGDPIAEALQKRLGHACRVEPFKFTAESKRQAVDALAQMIETGRIRLLDDPVQTEELVAYEYQPTAGGSVRTSAPPGMHDDTVMALALACWPRRERRSFLVGDLA